MSKTMRITGRVRAVQLLLGALTVVIGAGVFTQVPVTAQESEVPEIIRIEEDWGIVLNEPNDLLEAPQFHTVISPTGNMDSIYFQTSWNYWELPQFYSGGIQLQSWNDDECIYDQAFQGEQLSQISELVLWTQTMFTNGTQVFARIDNGYSSTWGSFGGDSFKLHADTAMRNLNAYDPAISVTNSWITYGSNRVSGLLLLRVRYYDNSGLVFEDDTIRYVYVGSAGGTN